MLKRLANFPVIDCMIILIGAMLLNTFYTEVALGHLTAEGFSAAVSKNAALSNTYHWWKEVLFWVAGHGAFFAPIIGPLFVATALCLILLIARGAFALIATLIYLVIWVSLWGAPGVWVFEYFFPLLFSLVGALATLPQFFDGPKAGLRILGTRVFERLNLCWGLVVIVVSAALLWYITFLSANAGDASLRIAWESAITFGLLLAISLYIDPFRVKVTVHKGGFRAICWVDVLILCVAAMMTLQVPTDWALNWYTSEGYASLVQSYAATSTTPAWFRAFIHWSGSQADFFMPIQAVFEAAVAILLSLLIFRAPVLVLTTGMLLTFNYAEFGVAASIETAKAGVTGTWELSFVNITLIFVCVQQIARFLQATSWRERIFGGRVFGKLPLSWCLMIALLAGALLFYVGMVFQVAGRGSLAISLLGGGAFAILLGINALINKRSLHD